MDLVEVRDELQRVRRAATRHYFSGQAVSARTHACSNDPFPLLTVEQIRKRPIVFLAHSFGGLVVQSVRDSRSLALPRHTDDVKALLAARLGTRSEGIDQCVVGCIFLGCTFGGTECAAVIDTLTALLRNQQGILNSLKPKSPQLFTLQHDFRQTYPDLPTACFYEQLKSIPTNTLVT